MLDISKNGLSLVALLIFAFGQVALASPQAEELAGGGEIRGKVTDKSGNPLPGAFVQVIGGGNSHCLTDLDGFWTLVSKSPSRVSVAL